MNLKDVGRISKLVAERRLSRRQALATGGAGVAGAALAAAGLSSAATQEAAPAGTPETVPVEPGDGEKIAYLFVQSFHSGSIAPAEGQDGRYTVTLEQGTGQTIYFADRPSRDVGVAETTEFLEGLGFPEDNPPNAAMILEIRPGETDIAVVELFNPTYDPETRGVTYDVEVLENWQENIELGFREQPADLATLAPEFGTAHLLIDDCPQIFVDCKHMTDSGVRVAGRFGKLDTCFDRGYCTPCEPYGGHLADGCATEQYWTDACNNTFTECQGTCWSDGSYERGPC